MGERHSDAATPRPSSPLFATTRWSVVLSAGHGGPEGNAALTRLCEQYWFPLYAWLRRTGHSQPDAEDLVQSFFARLIEHDLFARAQAQRGRFRTFLLSALANFATDEWRRENREKRGGGVASIPLHEIDPESRLASELVDAHTPQAAFDRAWARTLLARVLERLREECDSGGKASRFEALKTFLTGERGAVPLAEAAEHIGLSLAATKSLVHRLRQRYRELLLDEVAQTVSRADDVEDELRNVLAALLE